MSADAVVRTRSATSPGDLSEWAVPPTAVIVHDPVEAGAISQLSGITDRTELNDRYLFREAPDPARFATQHRDFVELVGRTVDQVHYLGDLLAGDDLMDQANDNPNQVYTGDAVITLPWTPGRYLPGRLAGHIRRPETATMRGALDALGLTPIVDLPDDLVLEGGDVIPWSREGHRTLLVGFGRRTQRATLDFLADTLIPEVLDEIIGIELAEWRINLDGGFVPVTHDLVVTHPASVIGALRIDGRGSEPLDLFAMLHDLGIGTVEVSQDESRFQQSCNCLCVGERKIISYDLTPRVTEQLRREDVEVLATPGSELVKGTGGPRCMSRPLYM